jgi:hypothetical protein
MIVATCTNTCNEPIAMPPAWPPVTVPGAGAPIDPPVVPPPVVSSIAPTTAVAGGPAFTLTVTGSGFTAASVISVNGADVATTFVNATSLRASITPLAAAGSMAVLVRNSDGQLSSTKTITITAPVAAPAPVITTIAPTTAVAGDPAFTLTVTGTGFTATSSITINGAAAATTFVSATSLTATVTPPAVEGTMTVAVYNSDGALTSNSMTISITAPPVVIPAPVLATIQPTTVIAGSAPFTLTVTGSNFEANSVINANNASVATTFVNASLLTATVTPPVTVTTMPVYVRNGDNQMSNVMTVTVNPDAGTGTPECVVTGYYPDCVTMGGVPWNLKIHGSGFAGTNVVQFDGVDQLTSYGMTPGGKESLSVNALTSATTAGVMRITVKEASGAIADVGDFTTFDPAVSDPPWVPTGASHYVDFLNDIQARGWNGVTVCDNVSMTAMLGNDSNAAAYHTPNPTGYNGNNVTADGYDWNKGQNQVPAFESTMKEAIIYIGATTVLEYNSNSTKNDIHFAIVASAASNHISIKKVGLDVHVKSLNGPLDLLVVGALIEPTGAEFVRNRIAFTKTIAPSLRFEIAVNGSPVVAGILDPADLTGLVAICDQSKLIGRYEVYPALPDTAGLSELSAQ